MSERTKQNDLLILREKYQLLESLLVVDDKRINNEVFKYDINEINLILGDISLNKIETNNQVFKELWKRLPEILYHLSKDENIEELKYLSFLEVLQFYISKEMEEISLSSSKGLCSVEDPCLKMLLSLVAEEKNIDKVMFRIEVLNLFKVLSSFKNNKYLFQLRKKLVSVPLSLQILISFLDDTREEVRYSLLSLILILTDTKSITDISFDLENYFAFSDGFLKLSNIIKQEIKLEGMVLDCLSIVLNIVHNNDIALKMFLTNTEVFSTIIEQMKLPLVSFLNENDENIFFLDFDSLTNTKIEVLRTVLDILENIFSFNIETMQLLFVKNIYFKDIFDEFQTRHLIQNQTQSNQTTSKLNTSEYLTQQSVINIFQHFAELLLFLPTVEEQLTIDPTQTILNSLSVMTKMVITCKKYFPKTLIVYLIEKRFTVKTNSFVYYKLKSLQQDTTTLDVEEVFKIDLLSILLLVSTINQPILSSSSKTLLKLMLLNEDLDKVDEDLQIKLMTPFDKTTTTEVTLISCLVSLLDFTLSSEKNSNYLIDVQFVISMLFYTMHNNQITINLFMKTKTNNFQFNFQKILSLFLNVVSSLEKIEVETRTKQLIYIEAISLLTLFCQLDSNKEFIRSCLVHPSILHIFKTMRGLTSIENSKKTWIQICYSGICCIFIGKLILHMNNNNHQYEQNVLLDVIENEIDRDAFLMSFQKFSQLSSFQVFYYIF